MNKKMIALAIAAAMPMAAAQAAPTVYGVAQVEYIDSETAAGVSNPTVLTDSGAARFGVKGSEDLGNGLSAVYKLEMNIDQSEGGALGSGRDAYVGLKGSFGTVMFGSNATAFAKVGLDSLRGTAAQGRKTSAELGTTGGYLNGSFADDTLAYEGKFGALTVRATASMSDSTSPYRDGDSAFSVDYKAGPLRVVAATSTNATSATVDEDATKFGVQYKLGAWKFTAQVENFDDGASDIDHQMLMADFSMGKNVITARLGNRDDNAGSDTDHSAVVFKHNFSKKTSVYAGVVNDDWTGDATALGMIIKF